MTLTKKFIGAIGLAALMSPGALDAKNSITLGDIMPFSGAEEQAPAPTEVTPTIPNYKSPEVVACLNNNTLAFTHATFFTQTKADGHQFPDLTTAGAFLHLSMKNQKSAAQSQHALQSACEQNPDLDLRKYAVSIFSIYGDNSVGISGSIHRAPER